MPRMMLSFLVQTVSVISCKYDCYNLGFLRSVPRNNLCFAAIASLLGEMRIRRAHVD